METEEKNLDQNVSENVNENNEKKYERRPRFTRPVDGERSPRPRFNREGGAPRYQRVEQRPQRLYQPRYNQDSEFIGQDGEVETRPRFSREPRPYGEARPFSREPRSYNADRRSYNGGESRPDRPYQTHFGQGEPRAYNREDQPRYSHEDSRYGQGEQRSYGRPQHPYQPRYADRENYGDRPQRPYQPRYEQGNSWDGGEEGTRPQRRSFNGGGNGYRPNTGFQGGYGNRTPKKKTAGPSNKYSKKKQIQYREDFVDPNEPIRLNKYLANAGVCSRREADEFIVAGVVSVNGQVVMELGTKVKRGDEVRFHDQPISIERKIYILLNKPKDYVTTVEDPQDRKTVMDLVRGACKERIYPVGRLDRNTTGVLLLTNDGEMASKLTHPSFMKKKVYHARLDKPITPEDLERLLTGIQLEDGEIRCDAAAYTVTDTDQTQVGIEIHSGRNRIVRRMFEALGYHVIRLDRTQFAGLTKKNLRRGDWRFLTEKEVNMLRMGAYE